MGDPKVARFVVLASSLTSASAWAQYGPGNDGYGPRMMWGGSWVGSLFGWFMMAIAFALLVALTVAVIRWMIGLGGHTAPPSTKPSALDILKERFARGEIDRDEFEERKRHLMD